MNTWRDELRNYIVAARANQLTESSPQAEQPTFIKTALRPHQLTLLAAARALESKASISSIALETPQLLTSYGVIADRVGSGKSLVALSLLRDPPPDAATLTVRQSGEARIISIRHMPPVNPIRTEWMDLSGAEFMKAISVRGDGISSDSSRTKHIVTGTALAIIPHNVMMQWESYVRDQTDIKAVFIRKTKDCDWERPRFYQELFTADIVIVSCTMLRKFIGAVTFHGRRFSDIIWSRLFIDEADTIVCSLRPDDVTARFKWFITGSWLNMMFPTGMYSNTVQHLGDELRALLGDGDLKGCTTSRHGIVVGALSDSRNPRFTAMILRNSDEWINTSLMRPVIVHDTIMCLPPANLQLLKDFISPAAMEALHAGDMAGAMTVLGLKAASHESLVDRVSASLRGELLQAEKILAFKRDMEYSSPAAKEEGIKRAEAKVARLREQLEALEARVAAASTAICPICYDTQRTATLTPCCRQGFCLSCLCECIATKPACPLCRVPIRSVSELMVIGEAEAEGEAEGEAGEGEAGEAGAGKVGGKLQTKGAALLRLLSAAAENPEQRFLVFSAHEASFKGLRELLSARGIRCELLSGTAARVERLRKSFRDGEVRVLCMNARHVGAGINLEAATHVVLYHRMNAELEKQVIGRAVRFERAAELRVIHLVHDSETAFNGGSSSEVIVHV
jgi:SNF2 family DNA or RNA helicase